MKTLGRREFLERAGGMAGLLALGAWVSPAQAQAGDANPLPSKADPSRIRKILDRMESQIGRYWSTPRTDAQFLNLLVKATRAVNVLEVGTSQGYSAIWMGLALEETDGRLTTIEIDTGRHALAQRNVRDAGLTGRVTLIRGDAHREIAGSRVPSISCSSMPTRTGRWTISRSSTRTSSPPARSSQYTTPSPKPAT